jgi:hypothetical protein
MPQTLGEAAKAVGKNRTTLLRAVKSGKLSATYDDALGGWLVEPAELHRIFPPISTADAGASAAQGGASTRSTSASGASGEVRELRARLEAFEAGQRLRDEVIEDLRRRLDTATQQLGEALQQVRLLTDQRTTLPAPPRQSWLPWRRRA